MTNDMQLSLKGDTFAALQGDFDTILNQTIMNMQEKGTDEAVITLKLKITLASGTVNEGYSSGRAITMPVFNHDISSVMQVKSRMSGILAGNYELVWDGTKGSYVMRQVDDGQVSV